MCVYVCLLLSGCVCVYVFLNAGVLCVVIYLCLYIALDVCMSICMFMCICVSMGVYKYYMKRV